MASGYTVSGRGDLDALFMARVNTKIANVNFQVNGSDISNRYEPRGSATAISATGFKAAGAVDLSTLFRDINVPLGWSLVAGVPASNPNAVVGYSRGNYGSLTPNLVNGRQVAWAYDFVQIPATFHFQIAIDSPVAIAKTFFNSCVINGQTFATSSSAFDTSNAPFYIWDWGSRQASLVNGNTYPVTFT